MFRRRNDQITPSMDEVEGGKFEPLSPDKEVVLFINGVHHTYYPSRLSCNKSFRVASGRNGAMQTVQALVDVTKSLLPANGRNHSGRVRLGRQGGDPRHEIPSCELGFGSETPLPSAGLSTVAP